MKKYDNFSSNLKVLSNAFAQDLSNEFIIGGIIDKFFVQFELTWKLFKELLKYEGNPIGATGSPRAVIKEAYKCYDFVDEDIWLDMLKERNDLTHRYDCGKASELVQVIIEQYIPEFQKAQRALQSLYGEELHKI